MKVINPQTGVASEGPPLPEKSSGGCLTTHDGSLWYLEPGSFDDGIPAKLLQLPLTDEAKAKIVPGLNTAARIRESAPMARVVDATDSGADPGSWT